MEFCLTSVASLRSELRSNCPPDRDCVIGVDPRSDVTMTLDSTVFIKVTETRTSGLGSPQEEASKYK